MKSFGVYFSGGATTVMSVLQLRADRLLDFGDGKGFAGHLVETFGRYEEFAAQHGAKLPRVHLRHQNLLEPAQQVAQVARQRPRSEEHTSELQSLMRISYAVFCLKKKKKKKSI